jgi:hypothetical protein
MNEEVLNMSVRKFLKKVGVTSQREIEEAVRGGIASGRLKGNEALSATVTLYSRRRRSLRRSKGRLNSNDFCTHAAAEGSSRSTASALCD